jgi:hypothetical protein
MFVFGNSRWDSDESAEPFIVQNLSLYHRRWLSRQSESLGQTRTSILEQILKEWLAAHPRSEWQEMDVNQVVNTAVTEFILRHREEFLPVPLSG